MMMPVLFEDASPICKIQVTPRAGLEKLQSRKLFLQLYRIAYNCFIEENFADEIDAFFNFSCGADDTEGPSFVVTGPSYR